MRNRTVIALEVVLDADLPVRLVLPIGARVERERVDVDPGFRDPLRHVFEKLREWRRLGVGVDEDERPPGLEPERQQAELLELDAAFPRGPRRGQKCAVETVGPRVVGALQRLSLPGSGADD